jgi:ubiquitin carboxyl-terminal hydrolase 9/24
VLFDFHAKIQQSWRFVDFTEFDSDIGLKQASGYVGLKNFGCTCYMNSLLQQLFMTPALKREFLAVTFPADYDQEQLDDNLLYQLQSVFANLQESEKSYFVPKGLVDTFKFYGEPVNVRVQ